LLVELSGVIAEDSPEEVLLPVVEVSLTGISVSMVIDSWLMRIIT